MNYNLDLSFLREWQKHFFKNYKKRNVLVVHRRAGKTIVTVTFLLFKALQTVGDYGYVAPFRSQAKKIAWKALLKLCSAIPGVEKNISELIVTLPNGSTISLFGADNQDSLRGLDLRGVVLDEYKDISKTLYSEIVAPMINAYKDGWTVWIGTPGGKNQFYDIYKKAKENPDKYYLSYLNVYETNLLDEEQIKDAIEEGTDENGDDAAFRQEYLLDWDVASKHAYFRYQIQELWKNSEKRIKPNLYNNTKPVFTAWDVGVNDYTCIVFFQYNNGLINIIDFFKDRGHGVEYYYEKLSEMPYRYAKHFLPHDMGATDFSTGLTRQEVFEENFGRESSIVLPRINIADGIEIVRNCFPLFIFDDSLNKYIETISEWGPKIDRKTGLPTNTPEHCDVTDTIRYLSMALKEHVQPLFEEPEAVIIDYNDII